MLVARLACRAPSSAAWKILDWLAADFFVAPDSVAIDRTRALAEGKHGDIPVVCGESFAANMSVLLQADKNKTLCERLGLNKDSRCTILGLERATEPKIYNKLVGKSPEEIFGAQYEGSRYNAPGCQLPGTAAYRNNFKAVEILLDKYVDINSNVSGPYSSP